MFLTKLVPYSNVLRVVYLLTLFRAIPSKVKKVFVILSQNWHSFMSWDSPCYSAHRQLFAHVYNTQRSPKLRQRHGKAPLQSLRITNSWASSAWKHECCTLEGNCDCPVMGKSPESLQVCAGPLFFLTVEWYLLGFRHSKIRLDDHTKTLQNTRLCFLAT